MVHMTGRRISFHGVLPHRKLPPIATSHLNTGGMSSETLLCGQCAQPLTLLTLRTKKQRKWKTLFEGVWRQIRKSISLGNINLRLLWVRVVRCVSGLAPLHSMAVCKLSTTCEWRCDMPCAWVSRKHFCIMRCHTLNCWEAQCFIGKFKACSDLSNDQRERSNSDAC
eukprot:2676581-Amphidinium_carterae.1